MEGSLAGEGMEMAKSVHSRERGCVRGHRREARVVVFSEIVELRERMI